MKSWRTEPLGIVAPKDDAPMPSASANVWNLSLEDIESNTGAVRFKRRVSVSELGSTKCSFDKTHVLYSKLRPYLNKVVLPDEPGVGTSELVPMRPDPARLEREFLAWYLRSPLFVEFALHNTRGANLPRLAMSELWKHRVPVPSIEQQRRIVRAIEGAISRVEELQRLFEKRAAEIEELCLSLVMGDSRNARTWVPVGDYFRGVTATEPFIPGTFYRLAGAKSFGRGLFENGDSESRQFR